MTHCTERGQHNWSNPQVLGQDADEMTLIVECEDCGAEWTGTGVWSA